MDEPGIMSDEGTSRGVEMADEDQRVERAVTRVLERQLPADWQNGHRVVEQPERRVVSTLHYTFSLWG